MSHDLEAELAAAKAAVVAADHAWQLAWGAGVPAEIQAAERQYDQAYARLSVLVRRKLEASHG